MNIVELIKSQAEKNPWKKAVIFPDGRDIRGRFKYTHLSFRQLERDSDFLAFRLKELGVQENSKVLLFIKPCPEFSVVAFALFKLGAVPVMIDPGMGLKNLLKAIEQSAPDVLIGVPLVCLFRHVFSRIFRQTKLVISTGVRLPGTMSLGSLLPGSPLLRVSPFPFAKRSPEDQAAILFTSGGTGVPKGVEYTHGIFAAQVELLREQFSMSPDDLDMPAFPLFSLMTQAMGVCSVIPPMNPVRPAKANPALMVETILDHGVTTAAGSPAIWERVANFCLKKDIRLPSLRSLMMFGAPVSHQLLKDFSVVMPQGDTWTPYGATECLPVSCIAGRDIPGGPNLPEPVPCRGICVGWPVPGTKIRIIAPSDKAFNSISEVRELPAGEVGEIIVNGRQVTPRYVTHQDETVLAKIPDAEGGLWHRMGDLGYLDEDGRLWFCGRKSHRVTCDQGRSWDSVPGEHEFNKHPDIRRTALVAKRGPSGSVRPALVIERKDCRTRLSSPERSVFIRELRMLARSEPYTRGIESFYLSGSFPTDPRHNIKIDRMALAQQCTDDKVHRL